MGGGFDVLGDGVEIGGGFSSLGGEVNNGEEEGGSMSGANHRTDNSGGSGDRGGGGGINYCTMEEERLDSTIGVMEERDPSTSYVVLTLGGRAWEVEGGPATWDIGGGVAGFHEGVEEGSRGEGGVSLRVTD